MLRVRSTEPSFAPPSRKRMDNLYSKRALLFKAAYCFCLPLLQILITSGKLGESLVWIFSSFILVGCLYTIPFWFSLRSLRRFGISEIFRLRNLIAFDAGCCFAPPVCCALLYEIGIHLIVGPLKQDGLYTLMLLLILLPISGIFWFFYWIAGKHTRP